MSTELPENAVLPTKTGETRQKVMSRVSTLTKILIKISIFNQNFDFWPKLRFLTIFPYFLKKSKIQFQFLQNRMMNLNIDF